MFLSKVFFSLVFLVSLLFCTFIMSQTFINTVSHSTSHFSDLTFYATVLALTFVIRFSFHKIRE